MGFYVPYSELSEEARTLDSAITSLVEELDATNYYNQRAETATDDSLREIMIHNRDEEIEHVAMLTEWLRRNSPEFDDALKTYLFTDAPITAVEASAGGDAGRAKASGAPSLGLGSLRK
jgi:ferritin-like protein